MKRKCYYLNIFVHPVVSNIRFDMKVVKQMVCNVLQTTVDEFKQKLYQKEEDKYGNQIALCYRGGFSDLATFADNVIYMLDCLPFRIEVFFATKAIVGDNICLYEKSEGTKTRT